MQIFQGRATNPIVASSQNRSRGVTNSCSIVPSESGRTTQSSCRAASTNEVPSSRMHGCCNSLYRHSVRCNAANFSSEAIALFGTPSHKCNQTPIITKVESTHRKSQDGSCRYVPKKAISLPRPNKTQRLKLIRLADGRKFQFVFMGTIEALHSTFQKVSF